MSWGSIFISIGLNSIQWQVSLELDSQFKPADSTADAPAASTLPKPQQGAGGHVHMLSCIVPIWWRRRGGHAAALHRRGGWNDTREAQCGCYSCWGGFKETTGLEKRESHTLQDTLQRWCSSFLLWILRIACLVRGINKTTWAQFSWQLRSLVDTTC